MNKTNKYADIEKMSFEKAMEELEGIVSELENGSIELEESIEKYQRGIQLKISVKSRRIQCNFQEKNENIFFWKFSEIYHEIFKIL